MTYKAKATRDGQVWLIEVDGVGATQARHLREAADMATDLVACTLDVPEDEVEVAIEVVLPDAVRAELEEAERSRRAAAEAQAQSAAHSRRAARLLAESGMPMRDVGRALGVSHQRVHQLMHR